MSSPSHTQSEHRRGRQPPPLANVERVLRNRADLSAAEAFQTLRRRYREHFTAEEVRIVQRQLALAHLRQRPARGRAVASGRR